MSPALYGALIGLARCTDGASPDGQTFSLFRDGLLAGTPEEEAAALPRLREEKWRLHPDCRACKNPCGRRDDYLGGARETENSPALKAEILSALRTLVSRPDAETCAPILYQAAFSLGEDGDDGWLTGILEKLKAVR